MTRRHRKPKRLPLPKGMPPKPAPEMHWLIAHEREREAMDEALRTRLRQDTEASK